LVKLKYNIPFVIKKQIPQKEYKKILEKMPICCVDGVVYFKGKVLLVLRNKEPAKNKWWFPGGRIFKNERLKSAIKRKIKEEIGIDVKVKKIIGIYETFFKRGPFQNLKTGVHTINVCFLCTVSSLPKIKLDKTSKSYKWIDKISSSLPSYVKRVLKDSKVFPVLF
jgi:ADP-ribose pyrophosphatase YjhB (NUDIX family)